MVFQSYALYPHLSVRENVGFPLKAAGVDRAEIDQRVEAASRVLKLDDYLDRRPKDLSGGQRQRVAIGRCIVREPVAFLFDEPLSNLDAALRVEMRYEIAKLHRTLAATMVYVTHDQVEAMTLADRIVVLDGGRIAQVGTPRELYESPSNLFVAQFIGSPSMNVFDATAVPAISAPTSALQLGVRPEALSINAPGNGPIAAQVDVLEYLGADTYVIVDAGKAGRMTVRVVGPVDLKTGEKVSLSFAPEALHAFDAAGQAVPTD